MLFCWKICFVMIYAVCREICFDTIYALLCVEKLNQRLRMLSKNDKYEVWCSITSLSSSYADADETISKTSSLAANELIIHPKGRCPGSSASVILFAFWMYADDDGDDDRMMMLMRQSAWQPLIIIICCWWWWRKKTSLPSHLADAYDDDDRTMVLMKKSAWHLCYQHLLMAPTLGFLNGHHL